MMVRKEKAAKWVDLDWNPIRPELTNNILGHGLLPKGATVQSIALTKVGPGGEFPSHTDDYHHVFCFIKGTGEGWSGPSKYKIAPERIVNVPAGTSHGYRNTGDGDLILLTINYN